MIRLSTERGLIAVDSEVYTNIAGHAANNCFGVKGMCARSMTDGLMHLLRSESMSKGVKVEFCEDGSIVIDLHIMVDREINIAAIGESIIHRVQHDVEKSTGTTVKGVNIYVDSISED